MEQESTTRDNSIRLTWQASERNKITVSHADQRHCLCQFWSIYGTVDYNASMDYDFSNIRSTQASWTMPASNRLLFEAGVSVTRPAGSPGPQPEVLPDDVGVQILSQGININALMWLGANTPAIYGTGNNFPNFTSRASMSYVTGSHNFKVGMTRTHVGENHPGSYLQNHRAYIFSEPGVPVSVRQYASPTASFQEAVLTGIYAQDQWTVDRLTLNLGVRYDHLNGWVPAQTSPVAEYVPAVSTGRLDNFPNFRDLNARLGAAYDLFGDGRTALKWNSGRYVNAIGTILAQAKNPLESLIRNTSRPWNDANGDLIPDCDFSILHSTTGECEPVIHPEFGSTVPTRTFAPGVLSGWNNRRANWQHSVGIQHELTDGLSIEVAYFRRDNINYLVADNLNIGPEHFTEFSIMAPTDPVLGDISGTVLGGLYTLTPEGAALGTNNQMIPAGDQMWGDLQRGRLHLRRAASQRHNARRRRRHGGVGSPRVLRYRQSDAEPGRILQLRAEVVRQDAVQVQWLGAAAVRHGLLVRVPEHSGRTSILQLFGCPAARFRRTAARSLVAGNGLECPAVPRRHRVLHRRQGRHLDDFPVRRQLRPVGAAGEPDRSAAHQDPEIRRGLIRANFDVFNILNASAVTRVLDTYTNPGTYPSVTGIMNGRLFKFGATIDW